MDKARYETIVTRAKYVASAFGFESQAEDFAQEAALQFSQGRKVSIPQLFIDYLRHMFGRAGHASEDTIKTRQSLIFAQRLVHRADNDDAIYEHAISDGYEPSYYRRLQSELTGTERAVFTLLFKYEFTLAEIGDAFGFGESRACQHMAEIKKKLIKAVREDN